MPNGLIGSCYNKSETFLFGLFLLLCSFVSVTEQGGIFGAPESLYKPTDHVVILNATNIKSTIYGTSNAWVVEFFSSWCGHCINFAPVYKQFAAEVEAWKNVVKIAGIDCADEANIATCREYEIMGYPTILFFPPHLKETKMVEGKPELNRGEAFQRSDKVSELKHTLMETVAPHFPQILGEVKTPLTTFNAVWKYAQKESVSGGDGKAVPLSLVILLFEKDKSVIGKELALRLSTFPEIRVLRFFTKTRLYDRLGVNNEWPAAGYLKPDRKYGSISIPKNKDIVAVLQSAALKKLKELNAGRSLSPSKSHDESGANMAIPEKEEKVAEEMEEAKVDENSNLEEPASNTVAGDLVSIEDLIHAVRNSLRMEVGMFKTIRDEKLKVLKKYVHTLAQLFPADRREMIVFLMKLDQWLEPQDVVNVNEYLDKMTELELELHPWDIDIKSWGTCRGSVPGRRGYTCGLWRLFHTVTLLTTQKSQEIFVLPVIYAYVKEFFGCSECVSHFTKMVHDEGALTISTVRAQALWLWRAHNKVNMRLKGSLSEDPGFPKELYPNEKLCPECHTSEGSFDEEKVFHYLIKVYTNPQRTMQSQHINEHVPKRRESYHDQSTRSSRTSSRFFSGTDYWIFFIVYLSVAGLLIFGYVHFKYGSRRSNVQYQILPDCLALPLIDETDVANSLPGSEDSSKSV